MISIRDLIITNKKVISLSEVSKVFPSAGPVSLRNLFNPYVVIMRVNRTLEAGDVSGWAEMRYFSNGLWRFKGHVGSDARIFDNDYNYSAWSLYKGPAGDTVYVHNSGTLKPDGGDDWDKYGHSTWIADNWEGVISHGTHFHLHQSSDFGWEEFGRVMVGVAGIALLLSPIFAPEHCQYKKDENGNLRSECTIQID
jgi:hypothetical protein